MPETPSVAAIITIIRRQYALSRTAVLNAESARGYPAASAAASLPYHGEEADPGDAHGRCFCSATRDDGAGDVENGGQVPDKEDSRHRFTGTPAIPP